MKRVIMDIIEDHREHGDQCRIVSTEMTKEFAERIGSTLDELRSNQQCYICGNRVITTANVSGKRQVYCNLDCRKESNRIRQRLYGKLKDKSVNPSDLASELLSYNLTVTMSEAKPRHKKEEIIDILREIRDLLKEKKA